MRLRACLPRSPWRPTAIEWLALLFVGVSAVAVLVTSTTSSLDNWAPNIAIEALAIAVTIAVVERIVAGQARKRLRPRTERAIYWMGLNLRGFGSAAAIEYSGTHLHTFKPLPDDLIELFEFWLAEQKHADAAQLDQTDAEYPMLIATAIDYYDHVKRHSDPNREVLEPELVRAVEDLSWHVGQAMQSYEFSRASWMGDRVAYHDAGLAHTVRGWLQFAEAFREHGDVGWLEVMDVTRSAAAEHSARMRSSDHFLDRLQELLAVRRWPSA